MITLTALLLSQSAWAAPAPQPSMVPAKPAVKEVEVQPSNSTRKLSTPIIPKRNGAIPIPKSTIPAGKRVEVKPQNTGATEFVISPKLTPVIEKMTTFKLSQNGPGKLVLAFQSRDPKLVLSLDNPIAIQVSADEPLEVDPTVITLENWPKKATVMTLNYKGAPAADTQVTVHAAYFVCNTTTKQCGRARIKFTYPMMKP